MHTTDLVSTEWCTPRILSPGSDAHHGYCLWGVMHIMDIVPAEWCTPRILSPLSDAHHGYCLHRMMHTTDIVSREWCTLRRLALPWDAHCTLGSFLKIWIYRRNLIRIRRYLGLFVRDPNGFESWKRIEVKKILWHTPFKRWKGRLGNRVLSWWGKSFYPNIKKLCETISLRKGKWGWENTQNRF